MAWLRYPWAKNDRKVYACFVDFQKTYDTIWRNGLFYKLMKYEFSQKIIFLLKSMYDRVVSAVKVKSGLTASFTPLVGVRQGCNLSPTLFNIFVNDIVSFICFHLWSLDHGRMQNQLFTICRWSYPAFWIRTWCLGKLSCYVKKWQMRINIKKTKAIEMNSSQETR